MASRHRLLFALCLGAVSLVLIVSVAIVLIVDPFWLLAFSWDYEVAETAISPDGTWTIEFFRSDPGATGAEQLWAKATSQETGRSRFMYYDDEADELEVVWVTGPLVQINGHLIDLREGSWRSPRRDE